MLQFQVRPRDEIESDAVQRALFLFGYGWRGVNVIPNAYQADVQALLADKDGTLRRGFITDSLIEEYPIANAEKIIREGEKKRKSLEGEVATKPVHSDPITEEEAAAKVAEIIGITPEELRILGERKMPDPEDEPPRNEHYEAALQALQELGYEFRDGRFVAPEMRSAPGFTAFWYVMNPKSGAPRVRHENPAQAEQEAKRLAAKHPGDEIVVLQAVATYTAEATVSRSLASFTERGA